MKIHWVAWERLSRSKAKGGLGFRELEAFNLALLAKQFLRIMHADEFLVFQVLKACYFPDINMMNAELGHRPSFTWRSLWGAKWVIGLGARWLVGDGLSLNIWDSNWIPRLSTVKAITPHNPSLSLLRVADLIDRDYGAWREDMIDAIFLAVDTELIKEIPLCTVWPRDRVMWYFSTSDVFTVRMAYHAIRPHWGEVVSMGSSSNHQVFWNKLWSLVVPPRIKMFLLRLCVHALPMKVALSKRISNLELKCEFCGAFQEDDLHTLMEFPTRLRSGNGHGLSALFGAIVINLPRT